MVQISDNVFCAAFLNDLDIKSKYLPNPYKPYPYLIINNFLSLLECQWVLESIEKENDAMIAKVKSTDSYGIVVPQVVQEYRKTKIYTLEESLAYLYNERFKSYQPQIESYFNLSLTVSTPIQALEYTQGGFYVAHADDSNALVDEHGQIVGYITVAPERKLTTVLFTTSCVLSHPKANEFTGGELVFNYLYDHEGKEIVFRANAGDMVVFPSNPYFTHEVLPVNKGYRLTLVQWHNAILG